MQAAILVYWPFYQLHKQICAAVDFSVEIKGAPTSKTHTSLHHLWLMLLVVFNANLVEVQQCGLF